jgi:putative phosphoesterase
VTTVGLIADLHGNVEALRVALGRLDSRVDALVLAGDAMNEYRFSDEIIELIKDNDVHYIVGNHELSMMAIAKQNKRVPTSSPDNWAFMEQTPTHRLLEFDGKRLLLVHGSPWQPYNDYLYESHAALERVPELGVDFLVLGHTHVAMAKLVGDTLVINPGSAGDARGAGSLSYAILDIESASVSFEGFDDPLLPPRHAEDVAAP